MRERDKPQYRMWNYSDKELIEELSRYSVVSELALNEQIQRAIICEALRRILKRMKK